MIADFEMVIPAPRPAATEAFIKLAARQHYAAWVDQRPRAERADLRKLGKMWEEIDSQYMPSRLDLERGAFRLSRDVMRMTSVFEEAGHIQAVARAAEDHSLTGRVKYGFAQVAACMPSETWMRVRESRQQSATRLRSLIVWMNGVKAAERQCGLR